MSTAGHARGASASSGTRSYSLAADPRSGADCPARDLLSPACPARAFNVWILDSRSVVSGRRRLRNTGRSEARAARAIGRRLRFRIIPLHKEACVGLHKSLRKTVSFDVFIFWHGRAMCVCVCTSSIFLSRSNECFAGLAVLLFCEEVALAVAAALRRC